MPREKKWEYLSVWADSHWFVMTDTRQATEPLPKQMGLVEYMNQLGWESWELVNLIPVEVGFRAFFKRPLQNEPDKTPQQELPSKSGRESQ